MTGWAGGTFGERADCVLAPNPNMMTLDGTNTWVLCEPGARRSVEMFTPTVEALDDGFTLSMPDRLRPLVAERRRA